MVNSNKLIFFLSLSGVGFPYVFYFMLPTAGYLSDYNLYVVAASTVLWGYSSLIDSVNFATDAGSFPDYGVFISGSVFFRGGYSNSLFFIFLFSVVRLSFVFLIFYFLFNFFVTNRNRAFFFKFYKFLKFNLFLNLPFLGLVDALSFFFFFIFTLYFSEIHFFFCNLANEATDSTVYQINFLMLSFSVIFFLKFFKLTLSQGLFFFVSFSLNKVFAFTTGASKKKKIGSPKKIGAFRGSSLYMLANKTFKFSATALIFLFFFVSTFFI